MPAASAPRCPSPNSVDCELHGTAPQLLDDPLSAVDPRVGRTLFDQCIGTAGLMAGGQTLCWLSCFACRFVACTAWLADAAPAAPAGGRFFSRHTHTLTAIPAGTTRLLVTHQRQFLPGCDAVLVLRGGEVAAVGSYAELAAAGVPEVRAVEGVWAMLCAMWAKLCVARPVIPKWRGSGPGRALSIDIVAVIMPATRAFVAAESSLDDSTYDAHTAADEAADEEASTAASSNGGTAAAQVDSAAQLEGAEAAAEELMRNREARHSVQNGSRTGFDRAVSLVFAPAAADSSSSKLAASSGGPGSRWQQKLSGSYVRRAVSARFGRRGRVAGGRSGGGGEEGSEEEVEEGGKSSLKRGKSGEGLPCSQSANVSRLIAHALARAIRQAHPYLTPPRPTPPPLLQAS